MNKFLLLVLIPTFIVAMEHKEQKLTNIPTPPERRLKNRGKSNSIEFCLTPDQRLNLHPSAFVVLCQKLYKEDDEIQALIIKAKETEVKQ